jgi:predicted nuclease of predicted toxin-antitoxin system
MRILADENVHMDIILGLRRDQHEVLFVPEVGLAGQRDINILEYAEKHGLILLSGDKDFGGLVEFGRLWGRGRIVLLRFRLVHPKQIVENILEVLDREEEILSREEPLVIVLSESGYRVHRPSTHRE